MARNATSLSDLREGEWSESFGTMFLGVGILAGALLLAWLIGYFGLGADIVRMARYALGAGALVGLGISALGLSRWMKAKNVLTVPYPCPYCEKPNQFTAPPREDFVCEHCSRTVHFEDGAPVEVRTVTCPACRTQHRVAISALRFVCDRCNRPIPLAAEPTRGLSFPGEQASPEGSGEDFDVLLVAFDRRQENELAFKLQDLLVVNLVEARKHLHSASSQTPLVVAMGVPQRKAEMMRRTLQELGATTLMRPTQGITQTPNRNR